MLEATTQKATTTKQEETTTKQEETTTAYVDLDDEMRDALIAVAMKLEDPFFVYGVQM